MPWPVDTFRFPLGQAATWLLAAALVCLAMWGYLRRRGAMAGGDEQLNSVQRAFLLGLRLAAIAALTWLLAGPSVIVREESQLAAARVAILADVSASMSEVDVAAPSAASGAAGAHQLISRWQALQSTWLSPSFLGRLHDRADVQLATFGERIEAVTITELAALSPQARRTDLFAAIRSLLQQRDAGGANLAAPGTLVILSDGHDTEQHADPALLDELRRGGWRVLAVPVGAAASVPDVALSAWADADHLFPGQSTFINVSLAQHGYGGEQVTVDLKLHDETVASQTVTLGNGDAQRLRFPVAPVADPARPTESLLLPYRVVARPFSSERVTDNNQRQVFIHVQRERIRVALFEGQPYWDTRYLTHVLGDDAQVELTAFFGLGPNRVITVRHAGGVGDKVGEHPAIAANDAAVLTADQLASFDVMILGKGAEQFFGGARAQLLVDFVRQRGGSLVLARGRPFDLDSADGRAAAAVLAEIEPVEWGQGMVRALNLAVTEAGRRDPLMRFEQAGAIDAIVTRLPDMLAATRIEKEKAASIVLLRQSPRGAAPGQGETGMAAVAHQNVGKGRVLAVLSDGLWRWAVLPSSLREFDSVYQMFWARTIRWLAAGGEFLPGQGVSLQLSRLTAEPDEPVTVQVATRYVDASFAPSLRIVAPDGRATVIPLVRDAEQSARFRAVIRRDQPGIHTLELLAPGMTPDRLTTQLAIYDQSTERLDPSARPQTLHAVADAAGGKCVGLADREELLNHLDAVLQSRQVSERAEYHYDNPLVLAAIVGLLGIEWFIRRRNGLP